MHWEVMLQFGAGSESEIQKAVASLVTDHPDMVESVEVRRTLAGPYALVSLNTSKFDVARPFTDDVLLKLDGATHADYSAVS